MLDVRRLRLLRELHHRGTIVAVAEALAYTPPAVSQQLTALEREVGRPLLRRTGRRVELTPLGRELAERTEAVLAALERAEAVVTDEQAPAVPVRLAAFSTALGPIVLPALRALESVEPRPSVEVTEVDPAGVPAGLRADRWDLALVHDYDNVPSVIGPGVEVEPLLDEVVYFASTRPVGETADVLREHRDSGWILGSPGTLCHAMAVGTCRAAGFDPRQAHTVDDFGVVLRLVAAGAGVALVPELGVADLPDTVVLTALPIGRRTRIAFRAGSRDRAAPAAVRAALHRAAAALRTPPNGDQGAFGEFDSHSVASGLPRVRSRAGR
ncbi:LysR family transcriptional regulator [Millisia brevis]|uniref:LysR family transcriptional regulator n=1 Tax=Millisia brevis TaxID=264148 RepID=UPI000A022149|nr:LysR family transcriptional regulator [Millisia brevis]